MLCIALRLIFSISFFLIALSMCAVLAGQHYLEHWCHLPRSVDLSCLLQALPFFISLGLAFTKLDDMALSAFFGTSLRHLNLRETKVVSHLVLYPKFQCFYLLNLCTLNSSLDSLIDIAGL
jgi:hypothetical protein